MNAIAIYGTSSNKPTIFDIYIDDKLIYENYIINSDFKIENRKIFEYTFANYNSHKLKVINKSNNPLIINYFALNTANNKTK
ncbi:UNVERIFIED_CONTAM: hypothetical protein O8I53_11765 [Campylobacter lari]